MIIVWDEPKRLANLDKHGLDFALLTAEFFAGSLVIPTGKSRFQAIGLLAGQTIFRGVRRPWVRGDRRDLDARRKPQGKDAVAMTKAARTKTTRGLGYTAADLDAVSDNPEWTASRIKDAKPFAEALPKLMESIRRGRGRPRMAAPKEAVTIRLSPDTLARFKARGKNWREIMVQVLDKAKV